MDKKWGQPKIKDVDNLSFVLIRQKLYDMIYELHMAESHKIHDAKKEYNVYWQNFCELSEYLTTRVDEIIYHGLTNPQSCEK